MKENRSLQRIHTARPVNFTRGSEFPPLPRLFRHRELTDRLKNSELIDEKEVINIFNYLNFAGKNIFIHLGLPGDKDSILLTAHPNPCFGRELCLSWTEEGLPGPELMRYRFLNLLIDDGKAMIVVPAKLLELNRENVTVQLPGVSHVLGQRQVRRYPCRDVDAELSQRGFWVKGSLVDFSPIAFRVRVGPTAHLSNYWLNSEESVNVQLKRHGRILFAGPCRYIRQGAELQAREMVLLPAHLEMRRFRKREIRNPRQELVPPPYLSFDHPLCNKRVQLEVSNISTSGFSVREGADEGYLMQGMIIPELTINFAGALKIPCAAQVVYRSGDREAGFRYGLSILDMDIGSYSRLAHLLANALDRHAFISSDVDLGALWEFLFSTGFIYPKKYGLIHSHPEKFKETYRRLYEDSPEIAQHFTFQRNGKIYGHISMVMAYERAWLIQHHAARAMDQRRAGFGVLKQIMSYLNDMHRLPSMKIDYVMSYFRPENKFPDRVFGGFSRSLKRSKVCSIDLFSYLPYTGLSLGNKLPGGWTMSSCTATDLWGLNRFYNNHSGGLLLDALGLGQKKHSARSLEEIYSREGFYRRVETYSLTCQDELYAVLIVNKSDVGLNLSEVLNCIKILVTNPEGLPWNILSSAIGQLTGGYNMERIPVLIYPLDYVKANRVPYEKVYHVWILDVSHGDEYMKYMKRKFRLRFENMKGAPHQSRTAGQ